MGTFVASATDPGQEARFAWALRSQGTASGWTTATDARAARLAAARPPSRRALARKVAALLGVAFCVAVVPAWSVVANEFPESSVGYQAQQHIWIPFAAMGLVLAAIAAWILASGPDGEPVPSVPGQSPLPPRDTAYLVTGHGLSVLSRGLGGTRRHDVLGTSVTGVTTRDVGPDHVTLRLATPEGDVVLPWIPRAPELLDAVAGWSGAHGIATV